MHGYAPTVSVGDIAHMDKSGTVFVPTSDQVGTIWNLLDTSAAKANSYTCDAYGVGRAVRETATWGASLPTTPNLVSTEALLC